MPHRLNKGLPIKVAIEEGKPRWGPYSKGPFSLRVWHSKRGECENTQARGKQRNQPEQSLDPTGQLHLPHADDKPHKLPNYPDLNRSPYTEKSPSLWNISCPVNIRSGWPNQTKTNAQRNPFMTPMLCDPQFQQKYEILQTLHTQYMTVKYSSDPPTLHSTL